MWFSMGNKGPARKSLVRESLPDAVLKLHFSEVPADERTERESAFVAALAGGLHQR
jgi:hypothetical protein